MTGAPRPTRLLVDGDVVAFMAAAAAQRAIEDPFGIHRHFAHAAEGEAIVENTLYHVKQQLGGDSTFIALSDSEHNWRRSVDPGYKSHRTGERPLLLAHLKRYLRDNHGAEHWPHLEADDVLSILATEPGEGRTIVVGRDKDFKSIPGLHHSLRQDVAPDGSLLIREVSPWEADRWHMMQSLAGDRIDGFEGCPGIGLERAAKIIDTPMRLVPQEGVKTRGVNKGEAVTKWLAEPTRDYWACIVSHYRKAGLSEDDALRTARLARLLRHGEYDRKTEDLRLWEPSMIRWGQTMAEHLGS